MCARAGALTVIFCEHFIATFVTTILIIFWEGAASNEKKKKFVLNMY